MDIEGAEKKLSAIDRFLTSLKVVLKKHWGILLLILFVLFLYWISTLPPVVEPEYYPEEIDYVDDIEYLSPVVIPADESDANQSFYYEEEDY